MKLRDTSFGHWVKSHPTLHHAIHRSYCRLFNATRSKRVGSFTSPTSEPIQSIPQNPKDSGIGANWGGGVFDTFVQAQSSADQAAKAKASGSTSWSVLLLPQGSYAVSYAPELYEAAGGKVVYRTS